MNMDIFDGQYYNWNKNLLTIVGQWPCASKASKIIRALFMVLILILSMPHLISAIVHYKDVDRLMLNILIFLTAMVMFLKMVAMTLAEKELKEVLNHIANNWLMIRDKKELEILVEYSNRSRTVTIFYCVSFSTVCIFMNMMPIAPKMLDKIKPLETPRPYMYLFKGEFFVDRETHFIELFLCDFISCLTALLSTLAADTIYIVSNEHCCAINAIISHRLRDFGQQSLDDRSRNHDDSYNKLVQIVQLHQETLSFTSRINHAYSLNLVFIMTANIIVIPLGACAIIASWGDVLNMLPYVIFFFAILFHFFVVFCPGQRVLDHNLSLCDDAYCNYWYTTPLRTRKFLVIFMLRCSHPASLKAGGLVLINYETFTRVVKTAISYITVLASFR